MYAVRYFLNLLKLRNAFSNVFPGGFERNTIFCLVGNLYLIWNSRDNFTYILKVEFKTDNQISVKINQFSNSIRYFDVTFAIS